jgi:hypothetical protein
MRQLQTVKDLATLFQKHENTIYRWITEDRLFPNAFRIKTDKSTNQTPAAPREPPYLNRDICPRARTFAARTFPSSASHPIGVPFTCSTRHGADHGDPPFRSPCCEEPRAGGQDHLPCMCVNILPAVGAAWVQGSPSPTSWQVSVALQPVRGSILSAQTIR